MSRLHQILGYGGLIPFFGLTLLYYQNFENADFYLIAYSALIFSFLGGLLWASTLNYVLPMHTLYVSVGTMLWSWVWLIFTEINWFIIISFSFFALYWYEKKYVAHTYSEIFLKLRTHLSLSAATILFFAYFI